MAKNLRKKIFDAPAKSLWMPNLTFKLIGNQAIGNPDLPEYKFHVPPSLTKLEIKDYLTKVYDMPVERVRTVNYIGKNKRDEFGRMFKRPDWKMAIVTMIPPLDKNGERPAAPIPYNRPPRPYDARRKYLYKKKKQPKDDDEKKDE